MSAEDAAPATEEPRDRLPDADWLIRWSTIVVVVAVALGAAYVSYRHAFELIHSHGEVGASAVAGPVTVDGLIFASGMVMLQSARHGRRPPTRAYFGLWLGILATIGANVAHGVGHGWLGALVSAWPAVALIFSYELLMWLIRTGAARDAEPDSDHAASIDGGCPHGVAETVQEAVVNRWLHGRDCLGEEPSQRQLATAFDIRDRKKVKAWIEAADPTPTAAVLDAPAVAPTGLGAPSPNGLAPIETGGE